MLFRSTLLGAAVFLAQTPANPDQALISDLAIANRILASDELQVLRVYGHVSARSQRNKERFYIARNIAPAFVTPRDIIETGMDGQPAVGSRTDQDEERFIDAAIYAARPDAMAIVHTHAPELIAFSVSSTALPNGGAPVPVFDVRKSNGGKPGDIVTAELGKALAAALGKSSAILLQGHGAVVVSNSIPAAISAANSLRRGAMLQAQMIAMRGTINPNPREFPEGRVRQAAAPAAAPAVPAGGLDTRNNAGDRAWDHWKRIGARMIASINSWRSPMSEHAISLRSKYGSTSFQPQPRLPSAAQPS